MDWSIYDKIGDFSLSEEELQTGLKWAYMQLQQMLTSMKNSESRTVRQDLVVF